MNFFLKVLKNLQIHLHILLEKIIELMTFQKNYISPKTCRYLRIVDNGIVLV